MAGNSGSSQINLNHLSAEELMLLQKLIYGNPHNPAQLVSYMLSSGNDNIYKFHQQISLSNYNTLQVVRSNQINLDQVKQELYNLLEGYQLSPDDVWNPDLGVIRHTKSYVARQSKHL